MAYFSRDKTKDKISEKDDSLPHPKQPLLIFQKGIILQRGEEIKIHFMPTVYKVL